jgi:hypothetical protein
MGSDSCIPDLLLSAFTKKASGRMIMGFGRVSQLFLEKGFGMRNVTRSTWWIAILMCGVVFFNANCGDESETITLDCNLEGYEGGDYVFTVDSVGTTCPISEELLNDFVSPGDQFPVVLPDLEEVPPAIDIDFGPPINTLTFDIKVQEDRIRVTTNQPTTIFVPGLGNATGSADGSLCAPGQGEILATFTISISLPPVSCSVQVLAVGT